MSSPTPRFSSHTGYRNQAELGFGFVGRKTQRLWVPYTGVEFIEGNEPSLTLGMKVTSGENAKVLVEFGRSEYQAIESSLGFDLRAQFLW